MVSVVRVAIAIGLHAPVFADPILIPGTQNGLLTPAAMPAPEPLIPHLDICLFLSSPAAHLITAGLSVFDHIWVDTTKDSA